MQSPAPRYAWLNGEIVAWDQCVLHARTQGAFWGANVFEGLRAYWSATRGQLYVFRMDAHLARLQRSMKSVRLELAYSERELGDACLELVRANELREDLHICIVPYFGMGPGFDPMCHTDDTGVHITALPKARSDAFGRGISVAISSWRRISDDTMPPRIKSGANYLNNRLAHQEAVRNGYTTALILNQRGSIAEAPGACVMMLRDGKLVTPPSTSGALEGITLATVADLARQDCGVTVEEREIDRTELYIADEVFLCGTLAEIQPVVSIDGLPVGDGRRGPLTLQLQKRFDQLVRGESARESWVTPVYSPVSVNGVAGGR
jgi:branched-chain amino acid aminotransferase